MLPHNLNAKLNVEVNSQSQGKHTVRRKRATTSRIFFAPVLAANLPLLSEAGGAKINFAHQQSKKKKLPSYPILTMCRKELSEVLPSEMELPMVEEDIQKGQWSISWDI